jgi:hypothetical protein
MALAQWTAFHVAGVVEGPMPLAMAFKESKPRLLESSAGML